LSPIELASGRFLMKNISKLFGIAVILFSMAACNGGGGPSVIYIEEPQKPGELKPPKIDSELVEVNTQGRLTITGLDSYEGRNIYAKGIVDYSSLYNFDLYASYNFKNIYYYSTGKYKRWTADPSVTITGGQAVMEVCFVTPDGYQNYNGNDSNVIFTIWLIVIKPSNELVVEDVGTVTVNFVNGVGTGVFN
jgi:hypothetical protein